MPYDEHFILADNFLGHLDGVISGIQDDELKSRYTGFVAVTSVTVYELAIKQIFFDFAKKKHRIFGEFVREKFSKMNGRIGKDELLGDHVKMFGAKYVTKFKSNLELLEKEVLVREGRSVKSCYANVILWRNGFVHGGKIPENATYEEARTSFIFGKSLVICLAESMKR